MLAAVEEHTPCAWIRRARGMLMRARRFPRLCLHRVALRTALHLEALCTVLARVLTEALYSLLTQALDSLLTRPLYSLLSKPVLAGKAVRCAG